MRGPHLTLDPYSSPVLALVTVADEHPRTVDDLQERVRARGYASASAKPHGLLVRLTRREFLARPDAKHYVVTPKGQLYREACTAQLPAYILRVFSLLTASPTLGSVLARYAVNQGWSTRQEAANALKRLCAEDLAEQLGGRGQMSYQLTPLGAFTQGEVAPAFKFLKLTPRPVPEEFIRTLGAGRGP